MRRGVFVFAFAFAFEFEFKSAIVFLFAYPSHRRPVDVHLRQWGFVSSHLTRRILDAFSCQYLLVSTFNVDFDSLDLLASYASRSGSAPADSNVFLHFSLGVRWVRRRLEVGTA